MKAKMGMFDSIVVQTVLYGCKMWAFDEKRWKRVDVLKIKCLTTIIGVRKVEGKRKDWVREKFGSKKIYERNEEDMLNGLGHMERLNEERLTNSGGTKKGDTKLEVERWRERGFEGSGTGHAGRCETCMGENKLEGCRI